MFRKTGNIALAILLLITTTGFSISKHYCGTHLVEVAINSEIEPCCGEMGNSNCCHNETEYFQLKEDFVSSSSIENTSITCFDILFPLVLIDFPDTPYNIEIEIENFAESPPNSLQTKLSLLQTYLC
jgi:hypothetical protein